MDKIDVHGTVIKIYFDRGQPEKVEPKEGELRLDKDRLDSSEKGE